MSSGGEKVWRYIRRWFDKWKIALSGILLSTKDIRFLVAFLITFIVFGTLMTLLSGSTAAWSLFWATDLGGKMQIIGSGFLGLFGVDRSFWDWCLTFVITILQSIIIGLIVIVWRQRRRSKREQLLANVSNSDNVQGASLAAGLAILGSGCPSCGTTLLAPLISTFVSTGSYALASILSSILTIAAIIVALFALRRLGNDAYALIVSERFNQRHRNNIKSSPTSPKKEENAG